VTDQQVCDTWVYSQLAGDSALVALLPNGGASIYNQQPPAGTLPPYVIFNSIPATDMKTNGNVRLMATYMVSAQIVIFDPDTGLPAAQTIQSYIDQDLFTGGIAANSYWIVCSRVKPINLAPNMRDRLYRYIGGSYEVKLRPITQPV
jgi:hypothetical protein